MQELALPAFEMDCRDWLVVSPEDAGLPEELNGAPLLAVLSTAVISAHRFIPASGMLTLGLLEDDDAGDTRGLDGDSPAAELVDDDDECLRFVVPAPSGPLALLAEFNLPDGPDPVVIHRVEALMRSFRWAA
jgi:hypothetical protein